MCKNQKKKRPVLEVDVREFSQKLGKCVNLLQNLNSNLNKFGLEVRVKKDTNLLFKGDIKQKTNGKWQEDMSIESSYQKYRMPDKVEFGSNAKQPSKAESKLKKIERIKKALQRNRKLRSTETISKMIEPLRGLNANLAIEFLKDAIEEVKEQAIF